uniref:Uncharacterized protein n=1 Tax=Arundo donax TaxID=35708 RepID=A0A0A8Z3I9_ARUDO
MLSQLSFDIITSPIFVHFLLLLFNNLLDIS